ncbi:BrnT family toxin [Azospirillum sp. B4]|uniref:BrnT family toxin n=1 Tax=Azospirillum sp. B4 TaxID=95605 RepID=UPI00034A7F0B|nr:BrnT family toxin [Azospirillum sp. B4]
MKKRFVWDPDKAASNARKHGITFGAAIVAFADPFALTVQDRFEDGEERWQTLGIAEGYMLLMVAHTIREMDENGEELEIIRIISARRADRQERRRYEQETR